MWPNFYCRLIYDNQEELNLWKDAFEEAIMVGLSDDKVRFTLVIGALRYAVISICAELGRVRE